MFDTKVVPMLFYAIGYFTIDKIILQTARVDFVAEAATKKMR